MEHLASFSMRVLSIAHKVLEQNPFQLSQKLVHWIYYNLRSIALRMIANWIESMIIQHHMGIFVYVRST